MELLGRFNDELTRVFDGAFGTEWAEIEEMLAIATVVTDQFVTTRRLADITGFNRRAVSRMVARLRSEGLVTTGPSDADKRAVEVILTSRGRQRADVLRTSIADFFRGAPRSPGRSAKGSAPWMPRRPLPSPQSRWICFGASARPACRSCTSCLMPRPEGSSLRGSARPSCRSRRWAGCDRTIFPPPCRCPARESRTSSTSSARRGS